MKQRLSKLFIFMHALFYLISFGKSIYGLTDIGAYLFTFKIIHLYLCNDQSDPLDS